MPTPGYIGYSSAKAGINQFTLTLAFELAPYVRVNCIAPGLVTSGTGASRFEPMIDKVLASIPLKRRGTPEDIALAALYLASSASEWVTGKTFEIDGGIHNSVLID